MKKIFISLAALLCVATTVSAQTLIVVEERPVLKNKKGTAILPQAGDVALGITASPFLQYMGNMFTRDGNNAAPVFNSQNAGVYMKFMTRDNQAIRAGVNVNFGKDYYKGLSPANLPEDGDVWDTKRDEHQGFGIQLGYEWRRGHGRLQGFYGAQIEAGYTQLKTVYNYGNAMDTTYPTPYSYDFNTNVSRQTGNRIIEEAGAANINAGLFGFVGVEYFFAPKMSLGGEVRLGAVYSGNGMSTIKRERLVNGTSTIETTEYQDPSIAQNDFNIQSVASGNIFVSFYF